MCPHCELAIPLTKITTHLKADQCVGKTSFKPKYSTFFRLRNVSSNLSIADPSGETNAVVCPLCEYLVEDSDQGWIFHLLDKDLGCEKNPRRKKGISHQSNFNKRKMIHISRLSSSEMDDPKANADSYQCGKFQRNCCGHKEMSHDVVCFLIKLWSCCVFRILFFSCPYSQLFDYGGPIKDSQYVAQCMDCRSRQRNALEACRP